MSKSFEHLPAEARKLIELAGIYHADGAPHTAVDRLQRATAIVQKEADARAEFVAQVAGSEPDAKGVRTILTPTDGRPCATDLLIVALLEDCGDHWDFRAALKDWVEGDWSGAFEYLEETSRDRLWGKAS